MNGFAKVFWKRLHPGTLTIWATCDSSGAIITKDLFERKEGKDSKSVHILSTSTRLKNRIKKEVRRKSFQFMLGGFILMLGSLSLNIIWIYLVLNARDVTKAGWLS